jgi:RNA polymerase sigma-70 factor (ECF subfamily)
MMNGDDDVLLVKEFKKGQDKAFDILFDKYRLSVYSICYRYTRNGEDAREITQDVFIKVYRNLDKFNEKSKLFTWLYRIVVNTCLSFIRKNKVRNDPPELTDSAAISMEERLVMKKAIDDALQDLPDRQRMAFILRHYDGYKFDEIAELMGITSGAAKANHHHAIIKLRYLLKEWL